MISTPARSPVLVRVISARTVSVSANVPSALLAPPVMVGSPYANVV